MSARHVAWIARFLLFVATLVFSIQTARADDASPRIVLVTNHLDAAIMPLLRAELTSLGMQVDVVDHGQDEVVPRDLSLAARRFKAVAGIRVLVAKGVVEVWIADRVTGKVVLREVLARESETTVSETVVVLRAVELLRASLMEVSAPHAPRGEVAPPPALFNVVGFPEDKERLSLDVGPDALISSGGVGPSFGLQIKLGYRVSPYLGLAARGLLSIGAAHFEDSRGAAAIASYGIGAGLELRPPPSSSPWSPFIELGMSAIATHVTGTPTQQSFLGYTHNSVDPAPYLAGGLSLRLTGNVRLSADILGAVGLRPVSVGFLGQEVASFGRLVGIASLRLGVTLP